MKVRLLYVKLSQRALKALVRRAASERRSPQDEAGLILERALDVRAPQPVSPGQSLCQERSHAGVGTPSGLPEGGVGPERPGEPRERSRPAVECEEVQEAPSC